MDTEEIAVLVLSTRNAAYEAFIRAVREGWMNDLAAAGVQCFLYSGDHARTEVTDDEIRVEAPDRLAGTARKLVSAVDTLLGVRPATKLIYRTNLSSYVDPKHFLRFVQARRLNEGSYAGVVGTTTLLREKVHRWRVASKLLTAFPIGRSLTFASGSGFFIGVNHARTLIDRPKDLDLIDDVMVARSLRLSPVANEVPARFDILEDMKHRVPLAEYQRMVEQELLFHYRFKTADRERDAEMLRRFRDPAYRTWVCTF